MRGKEKVVSCVYGTTLNDASTLEFSQQLIESPEL